MKLLATIVLVALTSSQAASAPPPQAKGAAASAPPVEVRTSVSRTAVWVGDRVTYVVELLCGPEVEVLTDDLAPERLKLQGLEVIDSFQERDASVPERVTYRTRYTVTTYRTDATEVGIAPIPVRYSVQRPGHGTGQALPAGEVMVPELKLALRSTIPANDPSLGLRDGRPLQALPGRVRYAQSVGLVLVAVAAAPVALWAAGVAVRAQRARARRRARPSARQRRAALAEIRDLDVSGETSRRDAYARLDALVRDHLHFSSGMPAAALTPPEILAAGARAKRPLPVAQIERVLTECERAKYAPEPPPSDHWPAAVDAAEDIITA